MNFSWDAGPALRRLRDVLPDLATPLLGPIFKALDGAGESSARVSDHAAHDTLVGVARVFVIASQQDMRDPIAPASLAAVASLQAAVDARLPTRVLLVARLFRPLLLEIVSLAIQSCDPHDPHSQLAIAYALAATLPVYPDAIGPTVLVRFASNERLAEHLHRLVDDCDTADPTQRATSSLLAARTLAFVAHSFVSFNVNAFRDAWDWSSLLALLHETPSTDPFVRRHVVPTARLLLGASEAQASAWTSVAGALDDTLADSAVYSDWLVEAHQSLELALLQTCNDNDDNTNDDGHAWSLPIEARHLSDTLVDLCGVLVPTTAAEATPAHDDNDAPHTSLLYALTPSAADNMHRLAMALLQPQQAILLTGPTSAGKTATLEHATHLIHRRALISIHIGDQTDSKTLLGGYVCTDTPGEFRWRPGALTRAVTEGRWLCIDGIDRAPSDVIAILIPLIEHGQLPIASRGDTVRAHPQFRLFATARDDADTFHAHHALWTRVRITPLPDSEYHNALTSALPSLRDHLATLIAAHVAVRDAITRRRGRCPQSRDLIKWCARLAQTSTADSSAFAESALAEGIDCLCGALPPATEAFGEAALALADALAVPRHRVDFFLNTYRPRVALSPDQRQLTFGRTILPITRAPEQLDELTSAPPPPFGHTRHALVLMERLAACIARTEPVLLCGETGAGKTTVIQHMASQLGQQLVVVNMSQQSDSADLLGGYKPVNMRLLAAPLLPHFHELFGATFSRRHNAKFLQTIDDKFRRRKWDHLIKLFRSAIQMVRDKIEKGKAAAANAETSAVAAAAAAVEPALSDTLVAGWNEFEECVDRFFQQRSRAQHGFAFDFVEGVLVRALRRGHWILLDEINLASPETLDCLTGLLESSHGSLAVTERGDLDTVTRHPNFRLFSCMNPSTDFGKRELPTGIRSRFTEFYVAEPDSAEDLSIIVRQVLSGGSGASNQSSDVATAQPADSLRPMVDACVSVYQTAKAAANEAHLADGEGRRPHFSLRSMCRAVAFGRRCARLCGGVRRALVEGYLMSFTTQLNSASRATLSRLIVQQIAPNMQQHDLVNVPPLPANVASDEYTCVERFWLRKGALFDADRVAKARAASVANADTEAVIAAGGDAYILTASVRANLVAIARAAAAGAQPVLLQGPTSAGKTSMVRHLALLTGHRFTRVNNHEHTDLQEYLGTYVSDEQGRLVFQEGVLVTAVREGHWIVLDELNLAPTDVLEALNRLLDDNRELFIPETQETVKPHRDFLLFATQNPAGAYAGRKQLSRAFRNRFAEIHFDDIPLDELQCILERRCLIAPSYCQRLVNVLNELRARRQDTRVFAGKEGFITLRDLFRWAGRRPDSYQQLAEDGYMLLAERCRRADERETVRAAIEKHIPRTSINVEQMYTGQALLDTLAAMPRDQLAPQLHDVVATKSLRRLLTIVSRSLENHEPVLLVGDTGCGKTTVCELLAALRQRPLRVVACHQHTETSDFLGSMRPVRSLGESAMEEQEQEKQRKWFAWQDGPLVEAMRDGSLLLVDEISLAEDSVLERLNPVLETPATLVLAEKVGAAIEHVRASSDFAVLATMNPGGDFGKKELSLALRNRFTEVWVPPVTDLDDMRLIIDHELAKCSLPEPLPAYIPSGILAFVSHCRESALAARAKATTVSLRDVLAWARFVATTAPRVGPAAAFAHGAALTFIDAMEPSPWRSACVEVVLAQLPPAHASEHAVSSAFDETAGAQVTLEANAATRTFALGPFAVEYGGESDAFASVYTLDAPTTRRNALRCMRALQSRKPILLEGSPGVGKTSLVSAIARCAQRKLVRINLSEQSDIADLFGSDLPVDGGAPGEFAWRDGPFLQAARAGDWVLLDELNLASQQVLEGLNPCLDHRSTVFVPELNLQFACPASFRVFAAQNPAVQGGGRKGLPRSFLNRFTQVHVSPLGAADYVAIASAAHPQLSPSTIERMVQFNAQVHTLSARLPGGPWEYNLRDVLRWCDCLVSRPDAAQDPARFVDFIYAQRLRSIDDRELVWRAFTSVFQDVIPAEQLSRCHEDLGRDRSRPFFRLSESFVQFGDAWALRRTNDTSTSTTLPVASSSSSSSSASLLLGTALRPLEHLLKCVEMNWMAILVGPAASGKTSLVRLLADVLGRPLRELAVNGSTDTSELLGGFEQTDAALAAREAKGAGRHAMDAVCSLLLTQGRIDEACALLHEWNTVGGAHDHASSLVAIAQVMDRLTSALQKSANDDDDKSTDDASVDMLVQVIEQCRMLLEHATEVATHGAGRFEWTDGALVHALQRGEWLLIDGANRCSAAVLDRLNALLEPGGVLELSEQGVVDGKIRRIAAHPDFRLFLTVDPRDGELSRAMRNRGIELHVDAVNTSHSHDLASLVRAQGVADPSLVASLVAHHCAQFRPHRAAPSLRLLLRAAAWTASAVYQGVAPKQALINACDQVYASHSDFVPADAAHQLRGLTPWHVSRATLNRGTAATQTVLRDASVLVDIVVASHERPAHSDDDVTRSSVLRRVRAAVEFFCSLASLSDWRCRATLLDRLAAATYVANDDDDEARSNALLIRDALEFGCTWLRRAATEHTLLPQAQAHLARVLASHPAFATTKSVQTHFLCEQPLDVQVNGPVSRYIAAGVVDATTADAFTQYVQLSLRTHTLRSLEAMLAQQQVNDARAREGSLWWQALRCDEAGVGAVELAHPVAEWLVPAVRSVRTLVLTAVSNCAAEDWSSELARDSFTTMHACLALQSSCNSTGAEIALDALAVCWRLLCDAIESLVGNRSSLVLDSHLVVVAEKLDASLGGVRHAALWRPFWLHGGHPRGFRSVQAAETLRTLVEASERLHTHARAADERTRVTVSQLRGSLCDAAVTVLLLNERGEDTGDGSASHLLSELASVASLVDRHLEQRAVAPTILTSQQEQRLKQQQQQQQTGSVTALRGLGSDNLNDRAAAYAAAHIDGVPGNADDDDDDNGLASMAAVAERLRQVAYDEAERLRHLVLTLDERALHADLLACVLEAGKTQDEACRGDGGPVLFGDALEQRLLAIGARVLTCVERPAHSAAPYRQLEWRLASGRQNTRDAVVRTSTALECTMGDQHWRVGGPQVATSASQTTHLLPLCVNALAVPLGELQAKKIQLEQVVEHLERAAPSLVAWRVDKAEWRILGVCFARVLLAYAGEAVDETLAEQLTALARGDATHFDGASLHRVLPVSPDLSGSDSVAQCIELFSQQIHDVSLEEHTSTRRRGHVGVHLGLLRCALVRPASAVDPAVLNAVKLATVCERTEDLEAEIDVRRWHEQVVSGGASSTAAIRERQESLAVMQVAQKEYEEDTTVRPNPPAFTQLHQTLSVHLGQGGIGSLERACALMALLEEVSQLVVAEDARALTEALAKERVWQDAQAALIVRLRDSFALYVDIVEPIVAGLEQARVGMRLVAAVAAAQCLRTPTTAALLGELLTVGSSCLCNSRASIGLLCEAAVSLLHAKKPDASSGKKNPNQYRTHECAMLLLRTALERAMWVAGQRGRDDEEARETLAAVMTVYMDYWRAYEAQRLEREARESELYKYTSGGRKKVYEGDTEEADIEAELRVLFPLFDADLAENPEQQQQEEEEAAAADAAATSVMDDVEGRLQPLDDFDVGLLVNAHARVYGDASSAHVVSRPDRVAMLGTSYEAAECVQACATRGNTTATTTTMSETASDWWQSPLLACAHLDDDALPAHAVAAATLSRTLDGDDLTNGSALRSLSIRRDEHNKSGEFSSSVDVYREAALHEVRRARAVLSSLREGANRVLGEFPGQPLVLRLREVCERVESFPVASPLMRFLLGLEAVLRAGQEWEEFAAKHVSLAPIIADVTAIVMRWRRLELHSWALLLDNRETECRRAAQQHWFNLYMALVVRAREADDVGEADAHVVQLFETIEGFLRNGTLGEFSMRMTLVRSFHGQVSTLAQSHGVTTTVWARIASVLDNALRFYGQYATTVRERLAASRTPIEKELKGAVQLARWRDVNYWSVRDHAERTHRTLHKWSRKYLTALRRPMAEALGGMGTMSDLSRAAKGADEVKEVEAQPIVVVDELAEKLRELKRKKKELMQRRKKKKEKKQKKKKKNDEGKDDDEEEEEGTVVSVLDTIDAIVGQSERVLGRLESLVASSASLNNSGDDGAGVFSVAHVIAKVQRLWRNDRLLPACPEAHLVQAGDMAEEIGLRVRYFSSWVFKDPRPTPGVNMSNVEEARTERRRVRKVRKTAERHMDALKRKALAHLLRQLRAMGLSWRSRQAVSFRDAAQLRAPALHDPTAPVALRVSPERARELCESHSNEADTLFYRALAGTATMRVAFTQPHSDILANALSQKCLGYVEDMLAMMLQQRRLVSDMSVAARASAARLTALEHAVDDGSSAVCDAPYVVRTHWVDARNAVARVYDALEQAAVVVETARLAPLGVVLAALGDASGRVSRVLLQPMPTQLIMVAHHGLTRLCGALDEAVATCVQLEATLGAGVVATGSLAARVLGDIVAAAQDCVSVRARVTAALQQQQQEEEEGEEEEVEQLQRAVVEQVMVAHQRVQSIMQARVREEKERVAKEAKLTRDDGDKPDAEAEAEAEAERVVSLRKTQAHFAALWRGVRSSVVAERIEAFARGVEKKRHTKKDMSVSIVRVRAVAEQHALLVERVLCEFVAHHVGCCRLARVMLGVFTELAHKGFCRAEAEADESGDEEEGAGGKGQLEVDGTGMGEGTGKKDVSDEIDNEGQVEGLEGDEKQDGDEEEQEQEEQSKEDKEKGLDMTNDFEGDLFDMDGNDEQEERDEEASEDELDEQMAEDGLDEETADAVDEKMWGDDSDDEQMDVEEENRELGKGVDDEKRDVEMGAKPEEEEEEEGKRKKEEEKEEEGAMDKDDTRKGEEHGKPEEKNEEGEEEDEERVKEEEYDEDRYLNPEDKGMALEDEEDVEAKEGEEEKEEEEGEGEGEGEDMELEDAMDVDGEEKEGGEGEAEEEEQEGGEEEDEEEAAGEGEMHAEREENGDDVEMEDGEGGEEEKELGVNDDNVAAAEEEEAAAEAAPEDVVGSRGADATDDAVQGMADEEENAEAETGERHEQQAQEMEEDAHKERGGTQQQQQQQQDNQREGDTDAKWKAQDQGSQSERKHDEEKRQREQQEERRLERKANPMRSVGDASKRWRERLKMLEETVNEDEEKKGKDTKETKEKEEEEEMDENADVEADAYEYVKNDDASAGHDAQVLGARPMEEDAPEEEKEGEEEEEAVRKRKLDEEKEEEPSGVRPMAEEEEKEKEGEVEKEEEEEEPAVKRRKLDESGRREMRRNKQKEKKSEEEEEEEEGEGARDMEDVLMGREEEGREDLREETEEDGERMRAQVAKMAALEMMDEESAIAQWQGEQNADHGAGSEEGSVSRETSGRVWRVHERKTHQLAAELCEQLRLIMEPQLAAKMQGDYRTGKRLNMKKVIPYVASQFKKDKIWLRRTRPSKRDYQILLCIDDSTSMSALQTVQLAFESLALVGTAMARLEAGQLAVMSFGRTVRLLHPFERPFTDESGVECVRQFTFAQEATDFGLLMESSVALFEQQRRSNRASNARECSQIQFVISDGRVLDGGERVERWMRHARETGILPVFIVLDSPESDHSLLDVKSVQIGDDGKIKMTRYLDTFPFPYYVLLRDIERLPELLSDALRQWFELLREEEV